MSISLSIDIAKNKKNSTSKQKIIDDNRYKYMYSNMYMQKTCENSNTKNHMQKK